MQSQAQGLTYKFSCSEHFQFFMPFRIVDFLILHSFFFFFTFFTYDQFVIQIWFVMGGGNKILHAVQYDPQQRTDNIFAWQWMNFNQWDRWYQTAIIQTFDRLRYCLYLIPTLFGMHFILFEAYTIFWANSDLTKFFSEWEIHYTVFFLRSVSDVVLLSCIV